MRAIAVGWRVLVMDWIATYKNTFFCLLECRLISTVVYKKLGCDRLENYHSDLDIKDVIFYKKQISFNPESSVFKRDNFKKSKQYSHVFFNGPTFRLSLFVYSWNDIIIMITTFMQHFRSTTNQSTISITIHRALDLCARNSYTKNTNTLTCFTTSEHTCSILWRIKFMRHCQSDRMTSKPRMHRSHSTPAAMFFIWFSLPSRQQNIACWMQRGHQPQFIRGPHSAASHRQQITFTYKSTFMRTPRYCSTSVRQIITCPERVIIELKFHFA